MPSEETKNGLGLWSCILLSFVAARYLAQYPVLLFLYGKRVWQEGIYISAMPRGRPYTVSNGDLITDSFVEFWLFIAIGLTWIGLTFASYWLFLKLKAACERGARKN